MALDPWNDIYTADGSGDEGQIIAYTPGGVSMLLTINANTAQALAFDGSGNLYEADSIVVQEYAARSTKPLRTIRKGTMGGDALAFDSAGNMYVGRIGGSVEVFAPGQSRPFRSITDGIRVPYALLFAKSGSLFVANCPSCYGSGHFAGSVTEYSPGGGTPIRTITKGIYTPIAMAVGRHGLLFVANHPFLKQGSVTVYSSGTTPVRTITDGIDGPDSLAIDPDGFCTLQIGAAARRSGTALRYTVQMDRASCERLRKACLPLPQSASVASSRASDLHQRQCWQNWQCSLADFARAYGNSYRRFGGLRWGAGYFLDYVEVILMNAETEDSIPETRHAQIESNANALVLRFCLVLVRSGLCSLVRFPPTDSPSNARAQRHRRRHG